MDVYYPEVLKMRPVRFAFLHKTADAFFRIVHCKILNHFLRKDKMVYGLFIRGGSFRTIEGNESGNHVNSLERPIHRPGPEAVPIADRRKSCPEPKLSDSSP